MSWEDATRTVAIILAVALLLYSNSLKSQTCLHLDTPLPPFFQCPLSPLPVWVLLSWSFPLGLGWSVSSCLAAFFFSCCIIKNLYPTTVFFLIIIIFSFHCSISWEHNCPTCFPSQQYMFTSDGSQQHHENLTLHTWLTQAETDGEGFSGGVRGTACAYFVFGKAATWYLDEVLTSICFLKYQRVTAAAEKDHLHVGVL